MPHVLNKLTDVKFEAVKEQLEKDAPEHAKNGIRLEHIWKNVDNPNEIFFLMRVDDLSVHKRLMEEVHSEARKRNPEIKLPVKIFLEE